MIRPAAALFAMLLVLQAGCATRQGGQSETDWDDVAAYDYLVREAVPYADGPGPALLADLYLPQSFGQLPAVLLIHGGGGVSGSRTDLRYLAERLAGAGFVAMTIDYRLGPTHPFPAQLDDIARALGFLREQAGSYQVDPARIAIWGVDTGATLAMLAASRRSDAGISAVVAGGGAYDLVNWDGGESLLQWLGTSSEAVARRASPIRWISAASPPSFIYHGGLDRVVPPRQAQDLHARLLAVGVPAELYLVRGLGHSAMFLIDRAAIEAGIGFLRRRSALRRVD